MNIRNERMFIMFACMCIGVCVCVYCVCDYCLCFSLGLSGQRSNSPIPIAIFNFFLISLYLPVSIFSPAPFSLLPLPSVAALSGALTLR